MNCPSCGMYVAAGASICPHCRTPFVAPGTSSPWNNQTVVVDYGTPQPSPTSSSSRVRTDRTFVMWLLLTFITGGLYHLYYVYRLAQDVNVMCAEDRQHVGGLLAYLCLGTITCGIYSIYWMYKVQQRLYLASCRHGVPAPWTGGNIAAWYALGAFLFGIGPLVAMYRVIHTANEVAYSYNGEIPHSRIVLPTA